MKWSPRDSTHKRILKRLGDSDRLVNVRIDDCPENALDNHGPTGVKLRPYVSSGNCIGARLVHADIRLDGAAGLAAIKH